MTCFVTTSPELSLRELKVPKLGEASLDSTFLHSNGELKWSMLFAVFCLTFSECFFNERNVALIIKGCFSLVILCLNNSKKCCLLCKMVYSVMKSF